MVRKYDSFEILSTIDARLSNVVKKALSIPALDYSRSNSSTMLDLIQMSIQPTLFCIKDQLHFLSRQRKANTTRFCNLDD